MNASQFLEKYQGRLKEQIERVKTLTNGLTDEQFAREAEPGVWGIGQILAHLNMATEAYIAGMGASITRGVPDTGGEPKHTIFAKLILSAMFKPNVPVPGSMSPQGERSSKDLETWLSNSERVLQLFSQAAGKDLVANKFKNPFLPVGKFNLADGFEIIVEHNERHIRQMEERVAKVRI